MSDARMEKHINSFEGTTAVILVGGLGTRLRSVVSDVPKVLADVSGRPFLSYVLDQLADAGLQRAVLSSGYLADEMRKVFGESYRSLRLAYSQEPSPLGTAGAVRLALPLCESATMFVMNGDSFFAVDVKKMWGWHHEHEADGTIALTKMMDVRRYGRVRVDSRDHVTGFEEKSRSKEPGWINGGIYLLSRGLVSSIPQGCAVSLEKDMFPAWVAEGLYGYCHKAPFLDIGTPESYASAEVFFSGKGEKA